MQLITVITSLLPKLQPLAPLALRLALGVVFIAHGADKLWGSFGGGGFEATVEQFTELGLKPAWFHATMGGYGELLGGLSVLLGLGTRFLGGDCWYNGGCYHNRAFAKWLIRSGWWV